MRRSWSWCWTCAAWLECPAWQCTEKSSTRSGSWIKLERGASDAPAQSGSARPLNGRRVRPPGHHERCRFGSSMRETCDALPPSMNTGTTVLLVVCVAGVAAQTPAPSARPAAFHLMEATIDEVRGALQSGRITCRGLVELYLKRIETYDKAGPALNAVQTINPRARQEADRLDAAFKSSGPVGPLHCIPVLVKDQVDTSDMPTTYGSAVFKDFVPRRDATIVTRLRKAGAVIVGKASMGEYASGYFGSASGPIRNAYDPSRNASGSSGGTGSGIAANFAAVGIGEDTGGSIRGPAAVSSLVGLRPTLPLVSRHGMFPARPTTDTLGPIARTVRDAALVLDVIAGYDPNDPVTAYAVDRFPPPTR